MKKSMMYAAAAMCVAAGAASAVDLRLVSTQNVTLLCDSINTPNFYIGNNPSVVALVGDNLFVGGYNNTNAAQSVMGVVKIEQIFGTRSFRLVPNTAVSLPGFRGYYGCEANQGPMRGPGQVGLIVCYDSGGTGTAGSYRAYDIATQLNPILLEEAPAGIAPRGGAGPSFDYGFNGAGFDLDGDSILDGPVMGMLDFSNYGGVQNRGPFGVRLRDSSAGNDAMSAIGTGRIYDGSSVNGGNLPIAPVLNGPDSNGCTISGTLWRDLAIDPATGNVAARASNDLILGVRNSLNGLASTRLVESGSTGCGTGFDAPFQILQRCEILSGLTGGAVVAYNDYGAGAGTVEGWTKFVKFDGSPATINLRDGTGQPFTAPSSGSIDYSWDAANQRLAILSFSTRTVYIFEVAAADPCNRSPNCVADVDDGSSTGTPDGGVGIEDLLYYLVRYDAGTICADVDDGSGTGARDGGVGIEDLLYYLVRYDAGC